MSGAAHSPIVPTCGRQREVLQAIRSRGFVLSRLKEAVVLHGNGRTIVLHGGMRSLSLGEVQRLGRDVCGG